MVVVMCCYIIVVVCVVVYICVCVLCLVKLRLDGPLRFGSWTRIISLGTYKSGKYQVQIQPVESLVVARFGRAGMLAGVL